MASNAYTWTFTAYNGHGAGKSVDVQAYVGINVPGKCGNVRISETGETGMVTVSWDAPATDVEGYPFDPDKCTYTLTRYDGGQLIPVADGLETLSHTFRAIPEGGSQAFLRYAVKAVSKKAKDRNAIPTRCLSAPPTVCRGRNRSRVRPCHRYSV